MKFLSGSSAAIEAFSGLAQAFFALCLLIVAAIQAWIYHRQRSIMMEQLRTSEKQLRAYLSIGPELRDAQIDSIKINCVATNHGITPALNIHFLHTAAVFESPFNIDFGDPPFGSKQITSISVAFPGRSFFSAGQEVALTQNQIAKIKADEARLYVGGAVRYEDAYGCMHTSAFRAFLANLGEILTARETVAPGQTIVVKPVFSYTKEGNTAD